jgi:hypothetical protein
MSYETSKLLGPSILPKVATLHIHVLEYEVHIAKTKSGMKSIIMIARPRIWISSWMQPTLYTVLYISVSLYQLPVSLCAP